MIGNCGVYMIRNKLDGKMYIGSSATLKKREYQHWRRLLVGSHDNKPLLAAYREFGRDSFEFVVIEYSVTSDQAYLCEREQFYFDTYKPFKENGYNMSTTVMGMTPIEPFVDEFKKYLVYDLKGDLLHVYDDTNILKEGCKELGLNYGTVRHRIYENDIGKLTDYYHICNFLIFMSELKETPVKQKIKTNKKVLCVKNMETQEVSEYPSMVLYAKQLGVHKSVINSRIRNSKSTNKYHYYYETY